MNPIEQRTSFGSWMGSEEGADRLNEAKNCRYRAENGVGIVNLWPPLNLYENDGKPSDLEI